MGEVDGYIETFRQEAEELLADVEEIVLAIEDNPEDMDNVNRLFRAMHTIKGSGSMFGFDDIAAFTHHVETVLDHVRSERLSVTKELIDLVLASRDQITIMLNATNGGSSADPGISERIVQGLNALAVDTSAKDVSLQQETPSQEPSSSGFASYKIEFTPDPSIFGTGMDPVLLFDELKELAEHYEVEANTDSLPFLENIDPESCYLSWRIILTTDKGIDAIKDVFIFVEDSCRITIEEIKQGELSSEDEGSRPRLGELLVQKGEVSPVEVQDALGKQKKLGELLVDAGATTPERIAEALAEQKTLDKPKAAEKNDTLRVASDKLDSLVNLVGELVINQARLTQISLSTENPELAMTVEEVERLTSELRDIVLNIRMMPIGTTFGRFKRLVRDLSGELGKKIEMVTEGADTELDKTVIDRLADPLVHLIRNSIDHGVESPEERQKTGKSERGTIRLSAAHTGTNVVITVEDDGKGLNSEAIRAKAIEKGLISKDEELSEKDTYGLIFAPGFSTAAVVTNVSGRGVGMDVVKREIDALRGTISVSSTRGEGTRIDLSLPLTLAIIDGLLVEVDDERFVVPLSMIEECLELTSAQFAMSRERNVIQRRGQPIPFVRIREIFDVSGDHPDSEEMVIVSAGETSIGIVVDHVIGDHQTVIKSLGKAYRDVEGVSGATILGDGSVALILDVPGLVKCARDLEEKITLCA